MQDARFMIVYKAIGQKKEHDAYLLREKSKESNVIAGIPTIAQ